MLSALNIQGRSSLLSVFLFSVFLLSGCSDGGSDSKDKPPGIAIQELARQTTNEDTPWNASLSVSLQSLQASELVVSASSSNQALLPDANLSVTGSAPSYSLNATPADDQYGEATITIVATAPGVSTSMEFVFVVVAQNDAPVATGQTLATVEETPRAVTLSGTDQEGDALNFVIVSGTANGVLNGTPPDLTYVPNVDFNGVDSFTFKANDGAADSSNIATVSITVTADNDAPVATAQSINTNEDTAKVIIMSGTDVDGDELSYAVVVSPAKGTLDGTPPNLTYTPNANVTGSDSFTFKVNDGTVDSAAAATISITINPQNDVPVATAQSVTTYEDTAREITLTGSDIDGDDLSFIVVSGPSNGALSGTAPDLVYTPVSNYTGDDSFTFKVNDGSTDSATTATVSISVNPDPDIALMTPMRVSTLGGDKLEISGSHLAGATIKLDSVTTLSPDVQTDSYIALTLPAKAAGSYTLDVGNQAKSIDYVAPLNAVQVSAGAAHSCAVLSDKTISCWGKNDYGQLGNGSDAASYVPSAVSGITTAEQVAVGGFHSCALLSNQTIMCWGRNAAGQLGNGSSDVYSNVPVVVSGIAAAVDIAAGYNHSCALLADKTISCWGSNSYGQLGNGASTNFTARVPVTVSNITSAVDVELGGNGSHSCAVLSDQTLSCWGAGYYGQLGNGTNSYSDIPVAVSDITTATSVSIGSSHTCALLSNKTVSCWGRNLYGSLGDGSVSQSNVPVVVSGITTAAAIAAGDFYSCALLADKTVSCWGRGSFGELGNGSTVNSGVPVAVRNITTAETITAGGSHTCIVLSDNTVSCWGWDIFGQLADSQNKASSVQISVSGLSSAVSISKGDSHTCALLADGSIVCWGRNDYGQLGDGSYQNSNEPVAVTGITAALSVSLDAFHSCAVLQDHTVKCWGKNDNGQLGNGNELTSNVPVAVSGITTAESVSVGFLSSCAILADKTVSCWGNNGYGQLGNGTYVKSNVPVAVSGLTAAESIYSGDRHNCAVLADQTVSCWGYNSNGQLGNSGGNSSVPVAVNGITSAQTVSLGNGHSCALLANQTVSCWGSNYSGQLGDSSNNDSSTPVAVSGINSVESIALGGGHSCALLSDHSVSCWGWNWGGNLGDGSYNDSNIPVAVNLAGKPSQVSAGGGGSCLLQGGMVSCVGYDYHRFEHTPSSPVLSAP